MPASEPGPFTEAPGFVVPEAGEPVDVTVRIDSDGNVAAGLDGISEATPELIEEYARRLARVCLDTTATQMTDDYDDD